MTTVHRSLVSTGAIYTLANVFDALFPIVLIPLLTRILDAAQMAQWGLFQATIAVLTPLVGVCMADALRAKFMHLQDDTRRLAMQAALSIVVLVGSAALLGAWYWRKTWAIWLNLPSSMVCWAVFAAICYALMQKSLAVCQFSRHLAAFLRIQILQSVISIIVMLSLLMYASLGWQSAAYGRVVGLICGALYGLWHIHHKYGIMSQWQRALYRPYIRPLFMIGIQYWPFALLLVTQSLVNRTILSHFNGLEVSGLYSVAESFAMVINLSVAAFILAWQPWMFSRFTQDSTQKKRVMRVFWLFCALLPVWGGVLIVCSWFSVPWLLGARFADVAPYSVWTISQAVAAGWFAVSQSFWHATAHVHRMAWYSVLVLAFHIPFACFLVIPYSVQGIATATIAVYTVVCFISMLALYRR